VTLPTAAQAARNNALWCDAVCRAHGVGGRFAPGLWTSGGPSPRFYPDAVTLVPDAREAEALALWRARGGPISVKDSFARLDLAVAGFTVLFDAEWHAAPPPAGGMPLHWRRVETPALLAAWETAWAGTAAGPRLFPPALLDDPDIAFLIRETDGAIQAGAIASRAAGLVGISNRFGPGDHATRRQSALASACLFPGLALVGYAAGDRLAAARAAGFTPIGPLRVWSAPITPEHSP
jgi:hypothetical protein